MISPLQITAIQLLEFEFHANVDFEDASQEAAFHLSLNGAPVGEAPAGDDAVGFHLDLSTFYQAAPSARLEAQELHALLKLSLNDDPDDFAAAPYRIRLTVSGSFSLAATRGRGPSGSELHAGCASALYSHARTLVQSMTHSAPYPMVLLPMIDFGVLVKEEEATFTRRPAPADEPAPAPRQAPPRQPSARQTPAPRQAAPEAADTDPADASESDKPKKKRGKRRGGRGKNRKNDDQPTAEAVSAPDETTA